MYNKDLVCPDLPGEPRPKGSSPEGGEVEGCLPLGSGPPSLQLEAQNQVFSSLEYEELG